MAVVTETAERTRARVRLFALLLVATLIVSFQPLPFSLAGIAFGAGAVWTAITSLVSLSRMRRMGAQTRGHLPIALGLGLSVVLVLMLLAEAAYYPILSELEKCRSGANTDTAQQVCKDQAEKRLQDVIRRLTPNR